jgi:hypothetical protein
MHACPATGQLYCRLAHQYTSSSQSNSDLPGEAEQPTEGATGGCWCHGDVWLLGWSQQLSPPVSCDAPEAAAVALWASPRLVDLLQDRGRASTQHAPLSAHLSGNSSISWHLMRATQ